MSSITDNSRPESAAAVVSKLPGLGGASPLAGKWGKGAVFQSQVKKVMLANRFLTKATEKKVEPEEDGMKRRFLFDEAALKKGQTRGLFEDEEPLEEDINEIVHWDDERVEHFVSTQLVGNLIESLVFRLVIFGVIIVNSILIALQTDEELSSNHSYMFSILEHIVLTIYVCEILLKWYYGFWIFWKSGWNILDFVVITVLILGPTLIFLGSSRILKILRVLRAFRSLKSVSALAGLSMVVQTILQSIPDMIYIVVLLTIILLVFGVAGVILFGKEIPSHFGTLIYTMFTLFICVTQDGWIGIYNTVKESKDYGLQITGGIYFCLVIMVGAFVFANLIVAVVVTNLELAMRQMREEHRASQNILATSEEEKEKEATGDHKLDAALSEDVPLVDIKEVFDDKKVDFAIQNPLQAADLRYLSIEKAQHYFLIITALEENLAEYKKIRSDLDTIFDLIREMNINLVDDSEDADDIMESASEMIRRFSGMLTKKGDILSNLISMEKEHLVSSQNAKTMQDIVRPMKFQVNKLHYARRSSAHRASVDSAAAKRS